MTSSPRLEFRFLDGARAVAAIAVAAHHAYLFTGRSEDHKDLPATLYPLEFGQFSVAVFIVLSGFVLMLPVASRPGLPLKGGATTFMRRRARRIIPPYLAAMALFWAVIALVPALRVEQGTAWDSKVPITPGGVISHLLLVHNLHPDWRYQGNGPTWSVATEWQIYFAMPLLLLPIWRRWGGGAAVATAVALGWGVHFALPQLDGAHLWYVADFAIGMLAASLVASRARIPHLGKLAAAGVLISLAVAAAAPRLVMRQQWLTEVAFGVVVAAVISWMAQRSLDGRRTALHRVLESRFLVRVGLWSFSLYLIHSPLLGFANLALLDVAMPTLARFAILVLVALPAAAAVAYVFHVLVERRFMTSHQQRTQPAANPSASVGSPQT